EDHSTPDLEAPDCGIKIYSAFALCGMHPQALEKADVESFINHLCTIVLPEKSQETGEEEESEEENDEENSLAIHTVISSPPSTGYQDVIPNTQQNLSTMDVHASLDKENTNDEETELSLIQKFTSIQRGIEYC